MNLSRTVELLEEALTLPVARRSEFFDTECGHDVALRAEVESLVAAHESARGFLSGPTISADQLRAAPCESPGTRIDRYTLIERIGEGGFGAVYRAGQTSPVKREVALKIIKLGMDTRQVIARFETERQALAMMDHPNIARVFDAGSTDTGRPFFVMELVHGVPITRFCAAESLSIEQRLQLFVQVCHAIQHAHQKGIIHRDIKPSNVLVATHDGHPAPKVIDFGIAKATQARLSEYTLLTEQRTMLGTPTYMSPEQARSNGRDIDTRSDIYALGVLLYELLTGSTPIDEAALNTVSLAKIQQLIEEFDAPPPSRRVRDAQTARKLRGELDWIVGRCLEKNRARRYATASALADDLLRYLAGDAIEAAPPSRAYHLRKFVARNRTSLIIALIVATATCFAIYGLRRGQQRALSALKTAQDANDSSRAVNEFFAEMLRSVDPWRNVQGQLTVVEVLDRAAASVGEKFHDRPIAEATIRRAVGRSYKELDRAKEAIPHLKRAVKLFETTLGAEATETLEATYDYALAVHLQDGPIPAEPLYRRAYDGYLKTRGPDFRRTWRIRSSLGFCLTELGKAAEAQPALYASFEAAERNAGPNDLDTLDCLSNLVNFYKEMDTFDPGIRSARLFAQRAFAATGEHSELTINARTWLGTLLVRSGEDPEEGARLHREQYDYALKTLGPDHNLTLIIAGSLIDDDLHAGRIARAESMARERLRGRLKMYGVNHRLTAHAYCSLAEVLVLEGKYDEALEAMRLPLSPPMLDGAPDYIQCVTYEIAGLACLGSGSLQEAEQFLHRSLAHVIIEDPSSLKEFRRIYAGLAEICQRSGRNAEAAQYRAKLGALGPSTRSTH